VTDIDISEFETLLKGAIAEAFDLTVERIEVTVTSIPAPKPGYVFHVLVDGKPAPAEIDHFMERLVQHARENRALS
jgi:hypothetical protein